MEDFIERITFDELSKITGISSVRAFESTDGFPQPIIENGVCFYNVYEVCAFFGVPDLNEYFISIEEVMSMFNETHNSITHKTRLNLIPSYQLKGNRGSKLLFRKSELEWYKMRLENKIKPEDRLLEAVELLKQVQEQSVNISTVAAMVSINSNLFNKIDSFLMNPETHNEPHININQDERFLYQDMKYFFASMISNNSLGAFDLNDREIELIKMRFVNKMPFSKIAIHLNLTKTRVRQIYNRTVRRLVYRFNWRAREYKNMDDILDSNKKLTMQNISLRGKVGDEEYIKNIEFRQTKLIEYDDVSVRVLNALKACDIETVEELMLVSKKDLLKYRNFGRKSLKELEEFMAQYGLKLKD